MKLERVPGGECSRPFPVYEDLVPRLLAAHAAETPAGEDGRDPVVAHVLATCAGYAYAEPATVALIMSRLGLGQHACVGIQQTVDAMFIFSTAYLVQSRCGRVVILCYRGTEAGNLGNWLGDADIGPERAAPGDPALHVHAGFCRNLRATRWAVIEELTRALEGRSLLDPSLGVEHPMEALYVAGHSLGGAMALLFALSLAGSAEHRPIMDRLRAVYTFGQPMAVLEPVPEIVREVGRRVHRHVLPRDVIPALPAANWGRFAHIGHEYVHSAGEWRRADTATAQLRTMREVPRSVLALIASPKRRAALRYTLGEHAPHHYIAALRPEDRVTEFGDRG